jgi:hypothetical protein
MGGYNVVYNGFMWFINNGFMWGFHGSIVHVV